MNLLKITYRSIPGTLVRGFSLVETMVAMVISLVLLNGVIQIFSISKQNYSIQEELSRLQENGRFAMDVLTRDIRMAGYLGCNSNAQVANSLNSGSGLYDLSTVITGFEGGIDTVPSGYGFTGFGNTDSVVVRFLDENNPYFVTLHNSSSATITLSDNHNLKQGEILVVADSNCTQIGIFQMANTNPDDDIQIVVHNTGAPTTPANCTNNLKGSFDCSDTSGAVSASYSSGSTLVRLLANGYHIGAAQSGSGVPALIRVKLSNSGATETEELIVGAEDLQVLYGVDTDADDVANQYDTANAVTTANQWQNAVSVRIGLLLRTIREVASQSQAYTFQGVTYSSHTDRYLRREFTTTIQLRNRGLS